MPAPRVSVQLASRQAVSRDLFKIGFAVPRAIGDTFVTPGQYIEIVIGEAKGFFALASVPGAEPWEIILRGGGGASDDLIARDLGTEISITEALGLGFPYDGLRGKSLVVAVTELGIGAGRSVVNQRILDGDAERTEFLLGTRDATTVPIVNELDQWRKAGVSTLICVTDPAPKGYYLGYIQDALRTLSPPNGVPRSADGAIFAVGRPELIDGLRAAAPAIGLRAERVYTNY